jgi:hypothetical protein
MSASPDRYLSVSTYAGVREWRVIGANGQPECSDGDLDRTLLNWRRQPWPMGTPIPVWDGDEGRWGVLATALRGMVLHDDDSDDE